MSFTTTRLVDRLRATLRSFGESRRLKEIQRDAATRPDHARPHDFVRGAQAAAALDRPDEALALYGRAIDAYLEAGHGRAAEVLCRKILERHPGVLRARSTLALLAAGRGDEEQAIAHLRAYAGMAQERGDPHLVRQTLRVIAVLGRPDGRLRTEALEGLRAIDDLEGVARVLRTDESGAGPLSRAGGQWARAVHAALLPPDELRTLTW